MEQGHTADEMTWKMPPIPSQGTRSSRTQAAAPDATETTFTPDPIGDWSRVMSRVGSNPSGTHAHARTLTKVPARPSGCSRVQTPPHLKIPLKEVAETGSDDSRDHHGSDETLCFTGRSTGRFR